MAKNIQIPAPYDTWLTIPEATERMGYKHSQYVRKLVKEEKLGVYGPDFVKLDMGSFEQWRINPEACDRYVAARAAGGSTFGQHAVRRMLLRFSTEHFTIEQITAVLQNALGDPSVEVEGEDQFRWEFTAAWKGGSGKKRTKKDEPAEVIQARLIRSLTESPDADDDEDYDEDYDDDGDEDDGDYEDELEDVLA